VLQHLAYFLAGVLLPDVPRRIAELRGRRVTVALAVAFAASGAIAFALDLPQSSTTLVAALTGVPLAIRLVVAGSRRTWFDGPAAALGRRTLPVYVMHIPVLSLLHEVVVPRLPTAPFDGPTLVLAAIYPLVGAVAVTGTSLLLHTVLSRSGLGFLFSLPMGRTAPEHAPNPS
jgi:peptidoglycan/LPS O-acetylase OafA/YrhL